MIVNYGPASRIADNEILLRLKEVEDGRYEDITRMSEIELELDGITSTVSEVFTDNDGNIIKSSELKQTIESIDSTVTNINEEMDTKIESKVTQAADSLSVTFATKGELEEEVATINATIDGLTLGGDMSITWDSLDEETKAKINDAIEASDAAWEKADGAADDVANMEAAVQSNADLLDSFRYGSTTYIDGSRIYSQSLYADKIHLGGDLTVYTTETGTTSCGFLGGTNSLNDGSSGVHFLSKNKQNECAVTNNGVSMRYGGTTNQASVTSSEFSINIGSSAYSFQDDQFYTPMIVSSTTGMYPRQDGTSSGGYYLGLNANRWKNVYSYDVNAENNIASKNGICTTSDRRLKNNIEDLPEKYIDLFDSITPRRYKMTEGTSDRYHVGFISQEIEEAMTAVGVESQEFGGFVVDRYEDEEGNEQEKYMLRYDEFIGILTAKIKQLETRIEELEKR